MVERSQVIVELLTGVKKVDLGVRPDPGTLLIGLNVQSAGRLCLLRDLDCNAFACIFYAASAAMKAVIIACPEVKPQGVLAGQEFTHIDVCQGLRRGDAYCQAQSTFLPRPTSDRRASLDCRVGWGCPRW